MILLFENIFRIRKTKVRYILGHNNFLLEDGRIYGFLTNSSVIRNTTKSSRNYFFPQHVRARPRIHNNCSRRTRKIRSRIAGFWKLTKKKKTKKNWRCQKRKFTAPPPLESALSEGEKKFDKNLVHSKPRASPTLYQRDKTSPDGLLRLGGSEIKKRNTHPYTHTYTHGHTTTAAEKPERLPCTNVSIAGRPNNWW